MLRIEGAGGVAEVSAYGGQVMSWVPKGGEEVLWRTTDAYLARARDNDKPLRGGVPICWPWFGAHPRGLGPNHGFARLATWEVVAHAADTLTLRMATDGSSPAFAHKAELVQTLSVAGDALTIELQVHNTGPLPFAMTAALHTYLNVSDIAEVTVGGLEGLPMTDLRNGDDVGLCQGDLMFEREVDAAVTGVGTRRLVVRDGVREVTLRYHGCADAVLWNPWAAKAATLDMDNGAWRNFVGVEGANLTPVEIEAGGSWRMGLELRT